MHLLVDGKGLPLVVHVTPGQRHESTCFEQVVEAVRVPQQRGRPRCRPRKLAGDKAYSYPRVRKRLRCRRIEAVIPQRRDQKKRHRGRPLKFDREAYRQRNVVERCVGWLKENRRVAARYEKLATNYLGMLKLAVIRRYLSHPTFSDRA